MTLTTHAVVGAVAASFFPTHPYAAFAAGFASHLAIDMLPHWSEGPAMLRSMRTTGPHTTDRDMALGKDFVLDVLYLGGESLAGLLIALLFLYKGVGAPLPIVLVGVAAGLLPDAMHFLYFKMRWLRPLRDFETFHTSLQNEHNDKRYLAVEVALVVGLALVRALA